jgi:adenylate cyclase
MNSDNLPASLQLQKLRLLSGLIMFSFLSMHLLNHALGLISIEAAEHGKRWFSAVWMNPVSLSAFYGAVLTHVLLVLHALYKRRTLNMPMREALQLIFGLLIPLLIIEHAASLRFSSMLYSIPITYENVIRRLWINAPVAGVRQSVAVVVIWSHGCIGLFFWLRYRSWYPRVAPYFLTIAVLVPVMALLGFSSAGRELESAQSYRALPNPIIAAPNELHRPDPRQASIDDNINNIVKSIQLTFVGMVGTVFLLRGARTLRQNSTSIDIHYEHGATVRAPKDMTLLEASRLNGISHYSVCGGRGRCSTCRVRILESDAPLPPPGDIERATLQRIHADQDIRLGCQLRPQSNLRVALLLSQNHQQVAPAESEPIRPGREEEIAVLFCDLRNFTTLTEARLPYDIVFLLNRYFAIVGQAIEQSGGRLDKFIGDGAMALFGLDGNSANACRDAMRAAATIVQDIERLNEELEKEFSVHLRIAIGVHTGPSIVGVMGYGQAKSLTAIGDTVNVASRLESVAKELNATIVVSEPAIVQSGAPISDLQKHDITVRGRSSQMRVYVISEQESARFLPTPA